MVLKTQALMCGIGVNDSDYAVTAKINGKVMRCPFYRAWSNMLHRCYSPKVHAERPGYIECSVVTEWLTFSKFKAWMETQDWEGKCLDKDILHPGNTVYGPGHCVFVTSQINTLLIDHAAARGPYPVGTYFHKKAGKFQAYINKYGKRCYLGLFTTPEDANAVYIAEKVAHIREVAQTQTPNIKAGLLRHAALMV